MGSTWVDISKQDRPSKSRCKEQDRPSSARCKEFDRLGGRPKGPSKVYARKGKRKREGKKRIKTDQ